MRRSRAGMIYARLHKIGTRHTPRGRPRALVRRAKQLHESRSPQGLRTFVDRAVCRSLSVGDIPTESWKGSDHSTR